MRPVTRDIGRSGVIRIGSGQGAMAESLELMRSGLDASVDYLVCDSLAEATCSFLAPAVFEHGWAWDDWDRLAAGIVVGHLLECSAQASGGNYSGDWWNTVDPGRVGLPIAEVDADGSAVITKPEGSAGRVSFDT